MNLSSRFLPSLSHDEQNMLNILFYKEFKTEKERTEMSSDMMAV